MDHLLHRKDKHKSSKASATHDKHHHHHHHSVGKNSNGPLVAQSCSTDICLPASLDIVIESPPCVFYGTPVNSTGALLSGRLRVNVPAQSLPQSLPQGGSGGLTPTNVSPNAPPGTALTLSTLRLRLVYTATTKKPVGKDCPDCSLRTEELGRWEFLTEPIHLKTGVHDFPFSYLLPGHLPATTLGSLGTVEYSLRAAAAAYSGEDLPPLIMPLRISRAVLPGNDKTSVRIFPPTNLAGKIILPSVVHPIGTFPVQMCLSGVVDTQEHTQTRWRLRKLIWRIEEHQKLVSTACPKHAHKLTGDAVAAGGPAHHETRIVGHGEEKTGWKTDFDTAGGEINFEFIASLRPGCEPLCDIFPLMKPDGVTPINPGTLEVRHNLVVELIVAEEFATLAPCGGVKSSTPTGAARVLRMLFHLNVTERSGLGISWDEEMPPVYADVPPSPPTYAIEPEDEEQTGLTGPGVNANGADASSRLPKLPQYSRLEQMDSFLTPVQRPQDAHPAAQNRVPLALPLQEVASLSLDNPTPRHSFSQYPPAVASSSSSHFPGQHHHQHSPSSTSAAPSHSSSTLTTNTSSASSSNTSIPVAAAAPSTTEVAHYQHMTIPRPTHAAPPHPPVDSACVLNPSCTPHVIGPAGNTLTSRRSSRSAYTHPAYAPSLLRRSSTAAADADSAAIASVNENAVVDDEEEQQHQQHQQQQQQQQQRNSTSQDPRSTQGSLAPSSAVTSATSSSVSLARLSTSSLHSGPQSGSGPAGAGAASGAGAGAGSSASASAPPPSSSSLAQANSHDNTSNNNNNSNTPSNRNSGTGLNTTTHATVAGSSDHPAAAANPALAAPTSSSSSSSPRHDKKKRRSTSFFTYAASSADSLRHARSQSHSHSHSNPFTPFLAPFVRARSSDRDRRHSRRSGDTSPANPNTTTTTTPSSTLAPASSIPHISALPPAHTYSARSSSRPAPVPEDSSATPSMMRHSLPNRSQSRPADRGRSSRSGGNGSSGASSSSSSARPSVSRRASSGASFLFDRGDFEIEPDLVRVNRTGDEGREGGFLRSAAVISHFKSL